jgi:VanZ family protein
VWRTWLPPAAYAALIFYLSSIPDLAPPVDMTNADKVAHFLEYGGFGLLLFRAAWREWGPRARTLAPLFTLGVGAATAALDELFQGTVGRNRSAADWAMDVVGLAGAALVGLRVTSRALRIRGSRASASDGSGSDDR